MPLRPTPSTAAASDRSAWRLPLRQFTVLWLAMSAVLHAESAAVARIVLPVVAALFYWAILSLNLAILSSPRARAAEGELEMVLRSTAAAAAALAGSLTRSRHAPFVVLCLAMGAALHAQPFVTASAEMWVHQGVVVGIVLGVAVLFYWAILSIHFFVAHTEGQLDVLLGQDRTAAEAPTSFASRHTFQHFVVLCLSTGALLHVEPLVDAAAELHIHPDIVVLAVMALFNWAVLSINIRVARRPAGYDHKKLIQPASAVRSPHPARVAFLVLAALLSTSWFVEPFAEAAEHHLPRAATIVAVLLFAAIFNVSTHLFRSFFLACSPSSGAAAPQGQSVGAITAGVIGVGILSVATWLFGAIGSAYYIYSPARA